MNLDNYKIVMQISFSFSHVIEKKKRLPIDFNVS